MTTVSTAEQLDAQLDPGLKDALARMSQISAGGAEQVREHVNALVRAELERSGVGRQRIVIDADLPLSVVVYRSEKTTTNAPGVLWIHGGAFKVDLDVAEPEAVRLAEAGAVVVAVGYRLPPEHPYPAAITDCYGALEWMAQNAATLGIDPDRIAATGKSTGGGLVAAVALLARDRGGPRLALQVLVEPQLDDRLQSFSGRNIVDSRIWDRDAVGSSWEAYLTAGVAPDQYAAAARAEDVARLPKAYVSVAQFDATRDEALDYATRLLDASVPVDLHLWPGTFHSFALIAPDADISVRSAQREAEAILDALGLSTNGTENLA